MDQTAQPQFAAMIPIEESDFYGKRVPTVDARKLWTALKSQQQFTDWITGRIAKCRFQKGNDFIVIHNVMKNSGAGRPTTEYHLTLDMAKHIAMIEQTPTGFAVREYFINCEAKLLERSPSYHIPETLAGALRLAADKSEECEALKIVNSELKPLADFADQISDTVNSISLADAAKSMGTGQNKFFAFLRDRRILIPSGINRNLPYQHYVDKGYFRVVKGTHEANGEQYQHSTTRITGKGMKWVHGLFGQTQLVLN